MNSVIDIAKDLVLSPLGAPTLPRELEITSNDVDQALIKYYSHLPYKVRSQYQFTTTREVDQDIAMLMPDYLAPAPVTSANWVAAVSPATGGTVTFTMVNTFVAGDVVAVSEVVPVAYNGSWTVLSSNGTSWTAAMTSDPTAYVSGGSSFRTSSNFFYVGVLHFANRLQVGSNRLNEYLLGTTYVFPNAEPDKQNLLNTAYDYHIGDPQYHEDFVQNRVNWIVGGSCMLSVLYGLGHKDPIKLPARHTELFAFLIGNTYYKRMIAIRKTGNFDKADFKLDLSTLEEVLKESNTRSAEILESVGLVAITIG